jgi:hypothetical protein
MTPCGPNAGTVPQFTPRFPAIYLTEASISQ